MDKRDKAAIFATISRKRKLALFHRLMDDGMFYQDWLEARIDEYTKLKPKGRFAIRKEA